MDNNGDDGSWVYNTDQWMDSSLFHPLSDDDEPMIEVMEGTETPASSSYLVDCLEDGGRMAFLAFPSTPPSSPLPLPSSSPSHPPALPSISTARPQSSSSLKTEATVPGSREPKPRNRRTIRKAKQVKPIPKYMLDPNDPQLTENQRASILHAIKCRQERLKKASEKESLKEERDRLVNEVAMAREKLVAERLKIDALKKEIDRRGHVILALSIDESSA